MSSLNALLDLFIGRKTLTVGEAADKCGISQDAARAAIGELRDAGMVDETISARRSPAYRLSDHLARIVAVRVTPSEVTGVCTDLSGNELSRVGTPVVHSCSLDRVIADAVRNASAAAGLAAGRLNRVVVGITPAGLASSRLRRRSPTGPYWREQLTTALEFQLGTQVRIRSAIALAAVAEARTGAATGVDDFVIIETGPRLEAALVLAGKVRDTMTSPGTQGPGALTPHRRPGPPCLDDVVARLLPVLTSAGLLFDPQLVVLRGRGTGNGGPGLLRALHQALLATNAFPPRLAMSAISGDATLLGAVRLAVEESRAGLLAVGRDLHYGQDRTAVML